MVTHGLPGPSNNGTIVVPIAFARIAGAPGPGFLNLGLAVFFSEYSLFLALTTGGAREKGNSKTRVSKNET